MYRDSYAYFLTASGLREEDKRAVLDHVQDNSAFEGVFSLSDEDPGVLNFDLDAIGGSVTEIDEGTLDLHMHEIAMKFPHATFTLYAENVDNYSKSYKIQTQGDTYQYAHIKSHMPELSAPVPFEERYNAPKKVDFGAKILNDTDFDLLYQQKQALADAAYKGAEIPKDVLYGLINFLDVIGDWAEQEGKFTYPTVDEPELPEQEEKTTPPALTREDVMGKEFYIDSTCYYHQELFETALSRCNGATDNCDRLRFSSDYNNRRHMNLGCIYDRARNKVFMTETDIYNHLKEGMAMAVEKYSDIKDRPYLLLDFHPITGRIKVEFVKEVKDPWTGEHQLHGPYTQGYQRKLPFTLKPGGTCEIQNCILSLFNREDLKGLAKAIAGHMKPYLFEKNVNKGLDAMIADAKKKEQGRGEVTGQTLHKTSPVRE